MAHCDGGLGGLWGVGASGRNYSPWMGLMAHRDGGLGGFREGWVVCKRFFPLEGSNSPLCTWSPYETRPHTKIQPSSSKR